MKTNLTYLILSLISVLSSKVYAHPGHDHNHWSADILHWAFFITSALLVVAVLYAIVKMLTDKPHREKLTSRGKHHAS